MSSKKKYLLAIILSFLTVSVLATKFQNRSYAATTPSQLKTEVSKIQGDSTYVAALLFNAFGTGSSQWQSFALTDAQISDLCGGPCKNIGVNSANFYSLGSGFYSRAQNLGMKYSLAIATNDTGRVIPDLNTANASGVTPVIRIGVQSDSGGFSDPQAYVNFLRAVNSSVSFTVYALAGPNEPESENWATPSCTTTECKGAGLARYMNAVISGAGSLTHIKLLSPAFNMTNAASPPLVRAMIANGANFNGVVAIAGNSYNISGISITEWVSRFMSESTLSGRPVFLTEIGGETSQTPTGTAPTGPKPDPFVPCDGQNEIRSSQGNTEFHSLRPYQSSPCNTQLQDEALYCGNDLIVKKTFTVNPSQGTCTTFWPDGSPRSCDFTFDNNVNSTNISVDLSNAKFPIMGNTENVVNEYSPGIAPQATDEQKVNEYVSWYLQGAKQKAEEPLTNVSGSDDVTPTTDAYKLVNLTGPLRRLLPERIQRVERYLSIVKATKNVPQYAGVSDFIIGAIAPNIQKESKDQTVGCNDAYNVIPCSTNTPEGQRRRLSFFLSKLVGYTPTCKECGPLLEESPSFQTKGQFDFQKFWTAYLNFLGNQCVLDTITIAGVPFQIRSCVGIPGIANFVDQNLKNDADIFTQIPFSSTEDRLGQTYTNDGLVIDPNLVTQPQSDSQVSNVQFVPTNTNHKLYFAHMQESPELATLIQNTFLPKGVPKTGDTTDNRTFYNTQRCEIKDARTNPGDNLFGNYTQPANSPIAQDQTVAGKISYTVKFTCEFPPPTPDQSCINNCIFNQTQAGLPTDICSSRCPPIQPTCTRTSLTALSIYTQTPKINDVWQQLVQGPSSVFKRIYPQVSPNAPITEIKDVPGVTQASYSGTSDEILAGDPNTNRSGSQAQLFFPHVGGIYDYFLKDIQKALRPKDVGDLTSGTSSIIPPPTAGCSNTHSTPATLIPSDSGPGSCLKVWVSPNDAQIFARDLGSVLAYQQNPVNRADYSFVGWAHYYAGTFTALGLNWQNPTDQQYQKLFAPCCGQSSCYQYILQRTLNESHLNPYLAIAIALNENGGLLTTDPNAFDTKHFGCDPFGTAGYANDIGSKLTCLLNTFNKNQDLSLGGADKAMKSYGYTTGVNDDNLNFITGVLGEKKPNTYLCSNQ